MNRLAFIALFCIAICGSAWAGEPLVIHEWGTFTALLDDSGRALPGVNTDDEPVPPFVYDVGNSVARADSELSPAFEARTRTTKGSVPRLHPDVTMRLETPVIYFYLPKGKKTRKLDVEVSFKGGWLTQYYPVATPNISYADIVSKRITAETAGTLAWKDLEVGGQGEGPATEDKVWLAPRAVKAANIRATDGSSEKFLFYRGLGNLPGPLAAKRDAQGLSIAAPADIARIWHVDVRPGGTLAYAADAKGARRFAEFAEGDYSAARLASLKKELQAALVAEGLYEDEAAAMLKTWEYSYFQAPGERIFYLVPQKWTDEVLPIRFSTPAKVTRVMIGRAELIGSRQKEALARLRQASMDDIAAFIEKNTKDVGDWPLYMDVAAGRKPVAALGAEVPTAYRDYLVLGRFRDAILLDEQRRAPGAALARFIEQNQIGMHQPQ
jgi:hypothetical protein